MEAVAVGGAGGEGRSSNKRGRVKAAADPGTAEPDTKRRNVALAAAAAAGPWGPPQQNHPASRIYRVSRASGGKDRHSKVYTAKGIRDRRVRLSVATAIQFYDLQDRLGYDQPSKAIEWLIKAAAAAIDKLPSLDAAAGFPAHPASAVAKDQHQHHHHHHTPPDADADADADAPPDADRHQQLTRSGCSSTSETSKGSVLSLSRSESRVKARERARERSAAAGARDKDKDPAADDAANKGRPATSSAQAASFTELLTGMAAATAAANADHKQQQQSSAPWQAMAAPVTADYIGFAQPRKAAGHAVAHSFASPAPHLANIAPIAMSPAQHFGLASGAVTVASGGGGGGEPHAEMTQFSFLQDHFMPVHAAPASAPAGDYNLNFSMSSGLVGVNSRGTLQSNSQPHISGHHHHHHQLQRLSTSLDAPNIPSFLFSPAAAVTTPPTAENQFAAFQLWNGFQHADMKEKGKN